MEGPVRWGVWGDRDRSPGELGQARPQRFKLGTHLEEQEIFSYMQGREKALHGEKKH